MTPGYKTMKINLDLPACKSRKAANILMMTLVSLSSTFCSSGEISDITHKNVTKFLPLTQREACFHQAAEVSVHSSVRPRQLLVRFLSDMQSFAMSR